jgi:polysaccharide export outer membrane protein
MASEIDSADNTETPARQIRSGGEERVKQQIKALRKGSYLVDSNDVLDILVFEEPDLSMTIRVSERGTISYPLIGEVDVKGLTTYEVEQTLEKRLRDGEYLKKPKVNIRLDIELMGQYREKEIFVMGEVENPGPVPILGKYITALEVIAKAGGFTEFAAPNRTTVVRVEDGVEKTIRVDLNKVKKGDKSLDITLKAGDIVIVPETYF